MWRGIESGAEASGEMGFDNGGGRGRAALLLPLRLLLPLVPLMPLPLPCDLRLGAHHRGRAHLRHQGRLLSLLLLLLLHAGGGMRGGGGATGAQYGLLVAGVA